MPCLWAFLSDGADNRKRFNIAIQCETVLNTAFLGCFVLWITMFCGDFLPIFYPKENRQLLPKLTACRCQIDYNIWLLETTRNYSKLRLPFPIHYILPLIARLIQIFIVYWIVFPIYFNIPLFTVTAISVVLVTAETCIEKFAFTVCFHEFNIAQIKKTAHHQGGLNA